MTTAPKLSITLAAVVALASACPPPEPASTPAPVAVAPPEAAPAPSPAPAPAAAADDATAWPPVELKAKPPSPAGLDELDPGDEAPPRVPPGLVPAELTDDLTEIEHPFVSPLAEPDGCLAVKSDQDCFWDIPTIVGFSRNTGEVALVYIPRLHAGAPQEVIGDRIRLQDGASQGRQQLGTNIDLDPERNTKLRAGVRKWVAGLKRDGFTAGPDLKVWGGAVRDRGGIAFPLAALGPPMTGWMLYAPPPTDDTLTLKLIAPDNKQEFVIGTTPVGAHCLEPKDANLDTCKRVVRLDTVTFGSVQLDPARTHLVALFSASPVGQDEETLSDWRVFALPPEVRATLPKP
jgi:hypothetical protein